MAKQKKKRNKKYTGTGAAQTRSEITHVTAVKRNKLQIWWLDKKRIVKPVSITIGVAFVIVIIVYELVRLFV